MGRPGDAGQFPSPSCSDLIPSDARLDYIPAFQLEFFENSGSLLLTLSNNKLKFGEKNLITSAAAGIH